MEGDDFNGVFGPGAKASQQHAVTVPSGRWTHLPLAFLWAGVHNAVRRHGAVRTVPSDAHRGEVDVGEGQVFWPVHRCRRAQILEKRLPKKHHLTQFRIF